MNVFMQQSLIWIGVCLVIGGLLVIWSWRTGSMLAGIGIVVCLMGVFYNGYSMITTDPAEQAAHMRFPDALSYTVGRSSFNGYENVSVLLPNGRVKYLLYNDAVGKTVSLK